MVYSVHGTVASKGDGFIIMQAGSIGLQVFVSQHLRQDLKLHSEHTIYCRLYVRDDRMELYGFSDERSVRLFDMLTSVSGVGPKTALGVFDVGTLEQIMAAIIERKAELLTRTAGVGKKTAERIVLELHNKLNLPKTEHLTKAMNIDADLEETLVNLGYQRKQVKQVLHDMGHEPEDLQERLKTALRKLSHT